MQQSLPTQLHLQQVHSCLQFMAICVEVENLGKADAVNDDNSRNQPIFLDIYTWKCEFIYLHSLGHTCSLGLTWTH